MTASSALLQHRKPSFTLGLKTALCCDVQRWPLLGSTAWVPLHTRLSVAVTPGPSLLTQTQLWPVGPGCSSWVQVIFVALTRPGTGQEVSAHVLQRGTPSLIYMSLRFAHAEK